MNNSIPLLDRLPSSNKGQIKHCSLKGGPEYFSGSLLLTALLALLLIVIALLLRVSSSKNTLPQLNPDFGGCTNSLLCGSDDGALGGFLDRIHLIKLLLNPLTTTSTSFFSLFIIKKNGPIWAKFEFSVHFYHKWTRNKDSYHPNIYTRHLLLWLATSDIHHVLGTEVQSREKDYWGLLRS